VISAGLVYPGEKDMPDSIGKLAKQITPSKD
jgi:hypothetical protein